MSKKEEKSNLVNTLSSLAYVIMWANVVAQVTDSILLEKPLTEEQVREEMILNFEHQQEKVE